MRRIPAAAALCGLLLLTSCARLLPENIPSAPPGEALCLKFVQEKLTGEDGGVHTNFLPGEPGGELAAGHEVLLESQGLLMRYYARTGDRDRFSRAFDFVREELDSGEILSYRLDGEGRRYPVNAAVDDLRVLRALLEGEERFRERSFGEQARQYAARLYSTNVQDGLLLDLYDESYKQAGRSCTLCYADLGTMHLLGRSDRRWEKAAGQMERVVAGGFLGEAFPFFHSRYLPDEGGYETDTVHMAEGLLTVLHLAEVNACPPETLRWLRDTLAGGPIYGEYTPVGEPVVDFESTAVYALCVRIGYESGDKELARLAMERLSALQVGDEASPVYGAFADPQSLAAYSFDNLNALLALRAWAEWEAGSR